MIGKSLYLTGIVLAGAAFGSPCGKTVTHRIFEGRNNAQSHQENIAASSTRLKNKLDYMARKFFGFQLPSTVGRLVDSALPIRHSLVPHRTILNRDRLRIAGQWRTPRTSAEDVAVTIESFDEKARSWGFRIPDFTKVLLIDRPLLPRLGSRASSTTVFSLSRGQLGRVIGFAPPFFDNSWLMLTVRHERAHNLIISNFKYGSYVNGGFRPVGEALADFLDVHFSGNPDTGLRNIEGMNDPYRNFHVSSIAGLKSRDYHTQSLIFSNLLWRLREEIGVYAMGGILLSFIKRLNAYGGPKKPGELLPNYEYFAAVLLKTAREEGYGSGGFAAVGKSARFLSLDEGRIASLAEELEGTDTMWRQETSTISGAVGSYTFAVATPLFWAAIASMVLSPLAGLLF